MPKGRPAKKYSQAARVHDIIRLIESRHGITLDELVEATGVNRRTIQRDLVSIQEAGYPLTAEWTDGVKLYRFITGFKDVPPIRFTLQELMTLSLLRSQLDLLSGTPFRDDVESIFGKVNSVLPPRFAAHMERIAQVALPLIQGRRDYQGSAEHLKAIREALLYQKQLTVSYLPAGRSVPENYHFDPYTLLFQKGGIYLLGYAHERKALRTFALERIRGVEAGKERFEIPEGFNPGQALEGAFGLVAEPPMEVAVRFDREVGHSIKDRVWHRSQEIVEQEDGGVLLKFRAGGKMEILSWLLSYGAHAEVLEPPELREEIGKIVKGAAQQYES
ncbi:helix-turn-helix transcriptional regulator [Geomesophilobacter sediminis]|uniref:Transcriptional regulator n=1 Tax=Geomesophilobacter sediminis TaxID=2798584 RepID=A0A8J7JLS0_9BACT|nr:transcriptional regulator [Geomesophilobacter sediminis]MBJ6725325.1 transcriptional regulator [Geomesophilobacter sediminis]